MASGHLHTCTSKGENFPLSLLPVASPHLLKQRDGNRALSEEPLRQHKSEGARHAQEKGGECSPRGKNSTTPSVKKPNQNQNAKPKARQAFEPRRVSVELSLLGTPAAWDGHGPLGGHPHPPAPRRESGAGATPTGHPANCGRAARTDGHGRAGSRGDPGRDPGRDSGREPGRDPGKEPGKEPGRDPGGIRARTRAGIRARPDGTWSGIRAGSWAGSWAGSRAGIQTGVGCGKQSAGRG